MSVEEKKKYKQEHAGLQRIKMQHFHKFKGRLFEVGKGYGGCTTFTLYKGKGDKCKYAHFITLAPEVIDLISKLPLKSYVRIVFSIKSVKHKEQWFTNLYALFSEESCVNEKKVKETQSEKTLMIEKSSINNLPNRESDFFGS